MFLKGFSIKAWGKHCSQQIHNSFCNYLYLPKTSWCVIYTLAIPTREFHFSYNILYTMACVMDHNWYTNKETTSGYRRWCQYRSTGKQNYRIPASFWIVNTHSISCYMNIIFAICKAVIGEMTISKIQMLTPLCNDKQNDCEFVNCKMKTLWRVVLRINCLIIWI